MKRLDIRNSLPYLAIGLVLITLFVVLGKLTPYRVGDGSEYYALFYAWSETTRPWMTLSSFEHYDLLVAQGKIVDLVSREQLINAFPALRLGETADFNHFWFYSFLAYIASKFLGAVGLPNDSHRSFLAVHFILLFFTFSVTYFFHKWRGVISVILMTVVSPVLWYFDKVHTELFTYCVLLVAIIFIYNKKFLYSAFFVSIASTQNPSFSLIAFIPYFYRLVVLRDERLSFLEVLLSIGTALIVLAHPVYYFFRFGVPTPQILAGGASLGNNLSSFYIWLFDPDLGLLPNWPIGVLVISFAVGLVFFGMNKFHGSLDRFFCFFLLVFFVVNFYAHSSTINLNSGATLGVARYSLWYLPVFFPVVNFVFENFPENLIARSVGVLLIIIPSIFIVKFNDPRLNENYATPTRLSWLIQRKASFLYDPPPEVFAERYSGFGEAIHTFNPRGILGPDCSKILIYPGEGRSFIAAPARCFVDQGKINSLIDSYLNGYLGAEPFYVRIGNDELKNVLVALVSGEYDFGLNKAGNIFLESGWSSHEAWGVWSNGRSARLLLPCNSNQFYANKADIFIDLLVQPFGSQYLVIWSGDKTLFEGGVEKETSLRFSVPVLKCRKENIELRLSISNPRSPLELGVSSDPRLLGIGLKRIAIN